MKRVDTGIKQLGESFNATIEEVEGRIAVCATNEGGGNHTSVPLADLLSWAAKNCPRLVIRALKDADEWDVESWKIDELRGEEPYVNNQSDPFADWDST